MLTCLFLFFHNLNSLCLWLTDYNIYKFSFNFFEILKFLRGSSVHPTVESDSALCIIRWSLTPRCLSQRWVRIENFPGLWLLLKEQSGKILSKVNTSIMGEWAMGGELESWKNEGQKSRDTLPISDSSRGGRLSG